MKGYTKPCFLGRGVNVMPLKYRRTDLCTSFAIKLFKSSRSLEFFVPAIKHVKTRNENQFLVVEQKCNTKRSYNAPHNYLARILNQNSKKIRKQK